MAGGRPKEPFKPWDGWYDNILDLYREGASDVEIRALVITKSDRDTFEWGLWDRWLKEEEEFSQTIKMGRAISHAWWERKGRTNMSKGIDDDTFNYTGWYMNMKNRFGWADKQEVKNNSTVTTNTVVSFAERD